MNSSGLVAKLRDAFSDEPLMTIAIAAAIFAIATTPLTFAVLGRLDWFKARRGRVLQRPEFSSIVAGMLLVMGIPAIFMALVIKSRHFDENRYEFNPNKTWSVLEQGRGYNDVKEADAAVKREMARLAEERKNLVDNMKKLDEAMLRLRAVAGTSPAVAQSIPNVLQRLAGVRKSVGLDGPQQLMDFTAPPVELASIPGQVPASVAPVPLAPSTAPAAPIGDGLSKVEVDAEMAAVPEPQRPIAAQLPLTDLPAGWTVGKSGDRRLETFNAENLFEKIDGRAESFIQYDVKGMAYTFYHPIGDPSNEVQVYIFQMADALKAFGKYGSEKPDDAKAQPIGSEGYAAAGSTLFYAGPYYTQIVSTVDDPKFAAFALELGKRIAAKQMPKPEASDEGGKPKKIVTTPESIFALLPTKPERNGTKYVAQDVFGYSFLADVFMADYQQGDITWQGFLRPYKDADEAKAIFEKYVENAKTDGAEIKTIEADGADRMVVVSSIGLVDVVFRKGNVVAGANGATEAKPAEAFARQFAKSLPADVPMIGSVK